MFLFSFVSNETFLIFLLFVCLEFCLFSFYFRNYVWFPQTGKFLKCLLLLISSFTLLWLEKIVFTSVFICMGFRFPFPILFLPCVLICACVPYGLTRLPCYTHTLSTVEQLPWSSLKFSGCVCDRDMSKYYKLRYPSS